CQRLGKRRGEKVGETGEEFQTKNSHASKRESKGLSLKFFLQKFPSSSKILLPFSTEIAGEMVGNVGSATK
ncbi:hypothetical protein CEXT_509131, partial [Caerostris extrusa]